ncbi:MAG TPA: serine/threonine-protein kinase [Planctomycetaceae bacterium]|nr:serine/threonine-protein kinase [Planctomycetaceae bacterium]
MKSFSSNCDPQLLQRSLEDVLSEQQEEWLESHLEDCATCQQQLTELAGDADGWSRVEAVLREEISGTHPLGRGIISTLIPGNLESPVQSSRRFGREILPADFAVDFLEPGREPDSLGRLNDIEIRAIIGHGGNGIVLKGYQKELNRLVAVKVMAPQLAANAEARKRFAREAQATAAIVHPNVMPILTVHSRSQLPYLVMPYVDCESLQQRLDREGSLPTLDVLRIGHQVARGLAAAHAQGLVHRDVKPANILLERGVDRVMLTDFGLARAVDDATLTSTGLIAGTPQYMSPEQARGDSVCTQSDLFSFGSVMYAMSTGRPPFRAQTSYGIIRRVIDDDPRPIGDLNSEIPIWLEGLIERLLAKHRDARFTSADEVAFLLQECIAHVQQPHSNPLPQTVKSLAKTRRRTQRAKGTQLRIQLIMLASLAVTLVVILIASGAFDRETNPDNPVGENPYQQNELTTSAPIKSRGESAAAWNDGIGEDLQQLDVEMDRLLEKLDLSELNEHETSNQPKGQ